MPKILLTLINIYLSAIISRVWKRIYNKFDECKEKMFAMYSIKCLLKDLERLLNGKTMLFSQPPVIFQSAFIWLNHRASSCITIQVNIYLNTSMWHFHDISNKCLDITDLYFGTLLLLFQCFYLMYGTIRSRNMTFIQLRASILFFYMKCDH